MGDFLCTIALFFLCFFSGFIVALSEFDSQYAEKCRGEMVIKLDGDYFACEELTVVYEKKDA